MGRWEGVLMRKEFFRYVRFDRGQCNGIVPDMGYPETNGWTMISTLPSR